MRYFAFLCFVIALYLSSHADETEGAILKTLNLRLTAKNTDRQTYSQFIVAQLRRALPTESKKVCNLPVLSGTTQGVDFLLLRLTNHNRKEATLAMDATNLYILGSAVYGKTENISFFFKNVPQATRMKLFGDTTRRELSYNESYVSLGDRSKREIGIPALRDAIDKLVNYEHNQPDRSAYLVCAQVISEAARFKYIERQISKKPGTVPTNFKPGPKIITLENKWSDLSQQIQLAVNNKGKFSTPIQLQYDNYTLFYVEDVNSAVVKEEIAILLNSRTPVVRENDIDDSDFITTAAPSEVMVETGGGGGDDDEATAEGGCGHAHTKSLDHLHPGAALYLGSEIAAT